MLRPPVPWFALTRRRGRRPCVPTRSSRSSFMRPGARTASRLEPEWAKAAEILADAPITLAKIDATRGENAELAEAHDVKGFPTVKIFRDGDTTTGEDLATVPRTGREHRNHHGTSVGSIDGRARHECRSASFRRASPSGSSRRFRRQQTRHYEACSRVRKRRRVDSPATAAAATS